MAKLVSTLCALLVSGAFLTASNFSSAYAQSNSTESTVSTDTGEPEAAPEIVLSPQQLAVQAALKSLALEAKGKTAKARIQSIAEFYAAGEFKPAWSEDGAVTNRTKSAISIMAQADEHGLEPADYQLDVLQQFPDPADASSIAVFDVAFSHSLVRFAQHLNAGRVSPKSVNRENVIFPEATPAATILNQAKSTISMAAYLRLLAPRTPRYERLRLAMLSYRSLANEGGWEQIAEGEVLKPGMEDERVPALKRRLFVSGDYVGDTGNPSLLYDGDIVDAVMAFQKRHGLAEDGVVGPNTLKEINMTVEERIAMMEMNLERRRWMQDDYGRYYVFANLADQVLKVVRDEKTIHAELIQVGKPYHRTPVFTDEMEYIELNPYWNVPYSIATKELLPELKQNPGKYVAQNYEVVAGNSVISPASVAWSNYSRSNFPFRIRQRPGKGNALGRVKFMFPNSFNVYIHDTPSKSKFDKASRFFSHGCLRLKDPLTMAEVILADKGWSRAKIDQTVASRKRTVVRLDEKIPVHIAYMTSWVNKDGSIHFRRDVYGRDKILAQALAKSRS